MRNFDIIERAVWTSDPYAQYHLGMLFRKGEDLEQDYTKAAKWIRLAEANSKTKTYHT